MSSKECEKIIEQALDPACNKDQIEKHCRHCAECAAVLACLGWIKSNGSPVNNIEPSKSWMNSLESRINQISTPSAAPVFSTKTAIALLIASAIVIATAITVFSPDNNRIESVNSSQEKTGSDNSSSTTITTSGESIDSEITAPVLQFPSPSDDIGQ